MKNEQESKQKSREQWEEAWAKMSPDLLVLLFTKQENGEKITLDDLYMPLFNAFVMGQIAVLKEMVVKYEKAALLRGWNGQYPDWIQGPSTDGDMDDFAVDRSIIG